jgi:hypothetical protein
MREQEPAQSDARAARDVHEDRPRRRRARQSREGDRQEARGRLAARSAALRPTRRRARHGHADDRERQRPERLLRVLTRRAARAPDLGQELGGSVRHRLLLRRLRELARFSKRKAELLPDAVEAARSCCQHAPDDEDSSYERVVSSSTGRPSCCASTYERRSCAGPALRRPPSRNRRRLDREILEPKTSSTAPAPASPSTPSASTSTSPTALPPDGSRLRHRPSDLSSHHQRATQADPPPRGSAGCPDEVGLEGPQRATADPRPGFGFPCRLVEAHRHELLLDRHPKCALFRDTLRINPMPRA